MLKLSITFFTFLILTVGVSDSPAQNQPQKTIDRLKQQIDSLKKELHRLETDGRFEVSPESWLKQFLPPNTHYSPFELPELNFDMNLEGLNKIFPGQEIPQDQIPGFNLPDLQKPNEEFFDKNFPFTDPPPPTTPWLLPTPPEPQQSIPVPDFPKWRIELLKTMCQRS